uniref:Uncharacterized protein n=1 Tax=Cacopsylla melanoneura TaxID=428564 RepID=A0A8D9E5Z4_9HEMI
MHDSQHTNGANSIKLNQFDTCESRLKSIRKVYPVNKLKCGNPLRTILFLKCRISFWWMQFKRLSPYHKEHNLGGGKKRKKKKQKRRQRKSRTCGRGALFSFSIKKIK